MRRKSLGQDRRLDFVLSVAGTEPLEEEEDEKEEEGWQEGQSPVEER